MSRRLICVEIKFLKLYWNLPVEIARDTCRTCLTFNITFVLTSVLRSVNVNKVNSNLNFEYRIFWQDRKLHGLMCTFDTPLILYLLYLFMYAGFVNTILFVQLVSRS